MKKSIESDRGIIEKEVSKQIKNESFKESS